MSRSRVYAMVISCVVLVLSMSTYYINVTRTSLIGDDETPSPAISGVEDAKDPSHGADAIIYPEFQQESPVEKETVADETGSSEITGKLKSKHARVNTNPEITTRVGNTLELFVTYEDGTRITGLDFIWTIEGDVGKLSSLKGDTVYLKAEKAGQVWLEASYEGFNVNGLSFTIQPEYQYSITVDIRGSGQVKTEPSKDLYSIGDKVILTSIPDAGYGFDCWRWAHKKSISPTFEIVVNGNLIVTAQFGKVIRFPDPKFETVVRGMIAEEDERLISSGNLEKEPSRNPDEPILQSQIYSFSYMDLSEQGISNLEGIQHFSTLNILDAGGNKISNLEKLSNLKNITSICLSDNQISNISPLKNLSLLNSLALYNNYISDISAISSLKRLERLELRYNNISDISALTDNIKLKTLLIKEGNTIQDFSPTAEYYHNLKDKDFSLE